ncbi:MAG: winged helix-turn-helix domain-containing protein, partial [Gemmatimonadales bacterium]
MNHRLRCNLLGPVEVEIDGSTPPVELMWRKNLGLLIYLVRHPDRVHARDHLMGLLWGEKEDRPARHSLREAIRVLRKCLWPELIVTEGDSVRVVPGEFVTDVAEFDSAVRDSNWLDAAGFVRGQ